MLELRVVADSFDGTTLLLELCSLLEVEIFSAVSMLCALSILWLLCEVLCDEDKSALIPTAGGRSSDVCV